MGRGDRRVRRADPTGHLVGLIGRRVRGDRRASVRRRVVAVGLGPDPGTGSDQVVRGTSVARRVGIAPGRIARGTRVRVDRSVPGTSTVRDQVAGHATRLRPGAPSRLATAAPTGIDAASTNVRTLNTDHHGTGQPTTSVRATNHRRAGTDGTMAARSTDRTARIVPATIADADRGRVRRAVRLRPVRVRGRTADRHDPIRAPPTAAARRTTSDGRCPPSSSAMPRNS